MGARDSDDQKVGDYTWEDTVGFLSDPGISLDGVLGPLQLGLEFIHFNCLHRSNSVLSNSGTGPEFAFFFEDSAVCVPVFRDFVVHADGGCFVDADHHGFVPGLSSHEVVDEVFRDIFESVVAGAARDTSLESDSGPSPRR